MYSKSFKQFLRKYFIIYFTTAIPNFESLKKNLRIWLKYYPLPNFIIIGSWVWALEYRYTTDRQHFKNHSGDTFYIQGMSNKLYPKTKNKKQKTRDRVLPQHITFSTLHISGKVKNHINCGESTACKF